MLTYFTPLHQPKCVGLEGTPAFIVKGCSDTLIPVFKRILISSNSQGIFPTYWKQAAVVSIFKNCKTALVNNHTPISTLNTLSSYFKLSRINTFRTILSPHLIPVSLDSSNLYPQPQIVFPYLHSIIFLCSFSASCSSDNHFEFSDALRLFPHALLLHKSADCGISPADVTWFQNYLNSSISHLAIVTHCRHHMKCYPLCHKDQFWQNYLLLFS